MKLLIFSDSHGTVQHMCRAIEKERPDYVIHLGDHVRDARQLRLEYPMLPIAFVRGNCDYGDYDVPEQTVTSYGGVRVMMAHGHRYGVKSGLLRYALAARESQVDVALFGHTHRPFCEERENLWLLNPGSCGYGRPTYGVAEIQGGKAVCRIHAVSESEEHS